MGRERAAKGNGADADLLPVLQIMRLVDASKEGRLGERGKPETFRVSNAT